MNAEVRYTASDLIQRYIELRDQVAEISERHKTELSPFNKGMELIETKLQDMLNAQGGDSIKTPHGTAYRSSVMSAKVEDWDELLTWILTTRRLDFFVRGVNKTAVKEAIDAEETVPGVSTETIHRINISRS